MKDASYKSILGALCKLRQTQLYFNKWIREDVLFKLIEQHNEYCQVDVALLKQSTFTNAFSRTSMNFICQSDIPNHLGIFRKCEQVKKLNNNEDGIKIVQRKHIYYYYFTKFLNSVPPKKINWMQNAMTSPVLQLQ